MINDLIAAKFCASPTLATIDISSAAVGLSKIDKLIWASGCNLVRPPTVPKAKGISSVNLKTPASIFASESERY